MDIPCFAAHVGLIDSLMPVSRCLVREELDPILLSKTEFKSQLVDKALGGSEASFKIWLTRILAWNII